MEFASADGAGGSGQAANGFADTYGKEISDQYGCEDHDCNERKGLAVKFVDPGIGAGLIQAALSHDGPIQLRQGAEGADHFYIVILDLLGEADGFRAAKLLRKPVDLLDQF